MFRSIVVPLDLEVLGDRALPVARSLAAAAQIPVELLTMTAPRMDGFRDAWCLEQRIKSQRIGPHVNSVVYDEDPAPAIVEHLRARPDALLVMASTAKSPMRELLFGSVSEHVLTDAHRPALFVGPQAAVRGDATAPVLIVAVDDSTDTAAAVPVIAAWQETFGSPAVQLVEVVPFAVTVGAGAGRREFGAERMSRRLAEVGVESSRQTLTSGDPATRLDRFARDIPNSVLLAMSTHWVSRRPHLHSTARALARRSSSPVLVVPAV